MLRGKGFDLVIAAYEPSVHDAAQSLGRADVNVDAVESNLATTEGVG